MVAILSLRQVFIAGLLRAVDCVVRENRADQQCQPVKVEQAEVAEGVIVREGSVLSMGVYLGASTRIIDRASGKVSYGEVPPYSVVVSGSMPGASGGPSLYCAVIVKQVDERTRAKTSINELLRD